MGIEKEDEFAKKRQKIDQLFKKLCHNLDSLSNFYYIPKVVCYIYIF